MSQSVPLQTFRRLPGYYAYLKELNRQGVNTVSAPMIAKKLNQHEVQVRKDLAAVSDSGGKPRTGFDVVELIGCIGRNLGYDNINDAVLVGVGHLGRALLSYQGFEEYGVHILAGFDRDESLSGLRVGQKPVFSTESLCDFCRRTKVHMGIITVPAEQAQSVCDLMVSCGILAIWNFAPVHLNASENILIANENMAVSLSLLSQNLANRLGGAMV